MMPRDQFSLTHKRGEIVMFRLHPFFQMWCKTILRTVALCDNYRELYYIHYFSVGYLLVVQCLNVFEKVPLTCRASRCPMI